MDHTTCRDGCRRLGVVFGAVERPPSATTSLLEVGHRDVDDDAMKPRRKLTIATPTVEVAVDLDEDRLDQIVDITVFANESGELSVNLINVRTVERLEGPWGAFSIRSMSSSLRMVFLWVYVSSYQTQQVG